MSPDLKTVPGARVPSFATQLPGELPGPDHRPRSRAQITGPDSRPRPRFSTPAY